MKTTHKHLLLVVALFLGSFYPFFTLSQVTETNSNPGDTIKYGANPEDCKINLSLYIEFYRQKKINDAYLPWSNVLKECPKSSKNLYLHGPSIIWNKINKSKDQAIKAKYGDTLMLMYDMRIKYFGEEGKVIGHKGLDFYKLYPKKKTEALNMLNRSLQIEGNISDIAVITAIFQISSELVNEKSISDEQFFEYYDKLSDIISAQFDEKPDSITQIKLQKAQENIDVILSSSGKATCEKIVPFFTKKFELNKDDISNLKTISKFLTKQKCTDSQLYKEVSEQIHKIDPLGSSTQDRLKKQ